EQGRPEDHVLNALSGQPPRNPVELPKDGIDSSSGKSNVSIGAPDRMGLRQMRLTNLLSGPPLWWRPS
ncbi:hypothetical protein M9458_050738, partial [Cirrhinus mrigala]